MKDILIIGGTGSGKTTLANSLTEEDDSLNYVYLSKYVVRVPLTLFHSTHPELLTFPKDKYLETIMAHKGIVCDDFSRKSMDLYCQRVVDAYGDTIHGETAWMAREKEKQNLFDNLAKKGNVSFLKDRGVYVVGLKCSFDTQFERRMAEARDIDPAGEREMFRQVKSTNEYFEIPEILGLADAVYDTDKIQLRHYSGLAIEILRVTSH